MHRSGVRHTESVHWFTLFADLCLCPSANIHISNFEWNENQRFSFHLIFKPFSVACDLKMQIQWQTIFPSRNENGRKKNDGEKNSNKKKRIFSAQTEKSTFHSIVDTKFNYISTAFCAQWDNTRNYLQHDCEKIVKSCPIKCSKRELNWCCLSTDAMPI